MTRSILSPTTQLSKWAGFTPGIVVLNSLHPQDETTTKKKKRKLGRGKQENQSQKSRRKRETTLFGKSVESAVRMSRVVGSKRPLVIEPISLALLDNLGQEMIGWA
jgi:hypothetical protein